MPLYYIISYSIILCYITLYCITLYNIVIYRNMLCYITRYCIMLHYIISVYITL